MWLVNGKLEPSLPDCPERISLFEGSPGLILEGHIEPSLEGVAIIIELEDGETIQAVTSNKGEYRLTRAIGEELVMGTVQVKFLQGSKCYYDPPIMPERSNMTH